MKLEQWHLKALVDGFSSIDSHDHQTYQDRVQRYTLYSVGTKKYRLFAYLIDLLEKNGFPTVVPNVEFEKLQEPMLYRGVDDINYNASTLADYDYHKGDGQLCFGIFATTDDLAAYIFCHRGQESETPDVLSFKLQGDAKIIDHFTLCHITRHFDYFAKKERLSLKELFLQRKFTKKHKSRDEMTENELRLKYFLRKLYSENKDLYKIIIESESTIALLLGYDAIRMEDKKNIAILNRGKMVVSESEFKRITDASKNYKGGVIDFDKKADDEFLNE